MSLRLVPGAPTSSMNALKRLIRWEEWVESKTPLFLAATYTWLLTGASDPLPQQIARGCLWLGFTICFLAFGYVINDYADRKVDRLAGKPNAIGQFTERRAIGLVLLIGLAGPLCLWPYLGIPWVIPTLLPAYFFAAAYSLPPVRFKERGVLGVVVSSTAQRLMPLLVGMALFSRFDTVSWIMAVLFSLIGVRWILVHQIGDLTADERGGVHSFARSHGSRASLRLMQLVVFPAELVCLAIWISLTAGQPMVLIGLPLYLVWLALVWRAQRRLPVSWTRFGELPLTQFYFIFWPLALALGAVLSAPPAVLIVAGHVLLLRPYLLREWRKVSTSHSARLDATP